MNTRTILWLLLALAICPGTFAQQRKHKGRAKTGHGHVVAAPPTPEIFVSVSQLAEYPGGTEALKKYLTGNIRYPFIASENGVEGKVVIRFVLDTDGSVSRATILKDIGAGCGAEVIRVLNQMPKWKPYIYNGRKVPYVVVLTTGFRVRN